MELASIIQDNIAKVDECIISNSLEPLSFEVNATLHQNLPKEVLTARDAAIEAMDELSQLLLGSLTSIIQRAFLGVGDLVSLHAICRFGLASTFPVGRASSVGEMAEASGLNEDDTRRILLHAMTHRIFRQEDKNMVVHTAASRAIREVPLLANWIDAGCEWILPAAAHVVNSMAKSPGSEEPNETAFSISQNTSDPFFEAISKFPGGSKRFADQMTFVQSDPSLDTAFVIDNYDWAMYESGTVVDVGGSHGLVMMELAKRFPSINCIVQDLPDVIASANVLVDQGFARRVQFQAHDIFQEQPVKGADVYFLRQILHDWGDKYSILILRNLIPALKPGARIVINDRIIPEPGSLPPVQERLVRSSDLVMKALFNSKERDTEMWTSLLQRADPKLRVLGVKAPLGSALAIIEVVWDGEGVE